MAQVTNNYSQFVEEYMEVFEPLFKKAFDVSEFNVIMTILAMRGMSDDGWDPFENTQNVFEEIYKQQRKFRGSLGFNINLWTYLHLIESSEHYEIIANLVNTVKGEDYIIANHRNKKFANLKVEQKIDRLKSIARGTDFENVYQPFESAFDARFRNAIAHGDYAIKSTGRSGVTIADDAGYPTIYELQRTNDLINRAVAIAYAREGADVAMSYLPSERSDADQVIKEIKSTGRKAVAIPGDLTDEKFAKELVKKAASQLGGLDIIVNNAGKQIYNDDIAAISTDQLIETFTVNVFAMFWIAQEALKYLPAGATIINASSIQATQPSPGLLDYVATKGAIANFTKGLAQQLTPKGIRVNAVAPGPI